jgi:hypothetical protein
LEVLHMLGSKLWTNYAELAAAARTAQRLVPTAEDLFLHGRRSKPPTLEAVPAGAEPLPAKPASDGEGREGESATASALAHNAPSKAQPDPSSVPIAQAASAARAEAALAAAVAAAGHGASRRRSSAARFPLPPAAAEANGAGGRRRSSTTGGAVAGFQQSQRRRSSATAGAAAQLASPKLSGRRASVGTHAASHAAATTGNHGNDGASGASTAASTHAKRRLSVGIREALAGGTAAAAAEGVPSPVTMFNHTEILDGYWAWRRKVTQRMLRIAAKAAVYRRRLIYVLMMDRLDTDAKVSGRIVDLLGRLRGMRAPAEAAIAVLRALQPQHRQMFFDALAYDLRQHGMLERASEKAAAEGMLAVAQKLCGCDVMRAVLGRLAAERLVARRKVEEEDFDKKEAAMLAAKHGRRFRFGSDNAENDDEEPAGASGGVSTPPPASPTKRGSLSVAALAVSPGAAPPPPSKRGSMVRGGSFRRDAAGGAGHGAEKGATPPTVRFARSASQASDSHNDSHNGTGNGVNGNGNNAMDDATHALLRVAAAPAVTEAELAAEVRSVTSATIAREVLLMQSEYATARALLHAETERRVALEHECGALRGKVDQLHSQVLLLQNRMLQLQATAAVAAGATPAATPAGGAGSP